MKESYFHFHRTGAVSSALTEIHDAMSNARRELDELLKAAGQPITSEPELPSPKK